MIVKPGAHDLQSGDLVPQYMGKTMFVPLQNIHIFYLSGSKLRVAPQE